MSAAQTITIRCATIADFAAITRLRNQLAAESRTRRPDAFRPRILYGTEAMFQALLVEPEVTVHVAECAGGVAGCAITWSGINGGNEWVFPQFVMFIRELVVGRAFQRRGVGRALVAAVEAAARLSGTEEIALFVDQSNTEAHAFYEALGLTAQSQYRHKLVRDVRRFDQQYNEIDLA